MVDVVSSAFIDEFALLRKRRTLVTMIVCIVSFVCGLPLCMQGGIYVFTVLNDYAAGYCIIALAFVELVIVSYCYGVRRFIGDCQMMIGHQSNVYWSYWMIAWSLVAPVFLLVSFIFLIRSYSEKFYSNHSWTVQSKLSVSALFWARLRKLFNDCAKINLIISVQH